MVFNSVIYNAARDGNLSRLKLFLDHKPKVALKKVVSAITDGSTPLVIASRNGYLDVVEYLIEQCGADVEQVGHVKFDGETIEGAPPLWCAAAAGHFDIVKKLVFCKASLNSTTKTNSTPLRAACFDGHYEIAKYLIETGADIEIANRHGHTCLMIACYKGHYEIAEYLLCRGANVNTKSIKGNTALHDCAENGSLEIFRLLLQYGAKMDVDSRGMSPLLSAAVTGHARIVEFLISEAEMPCTIEETVDALELLGATFMDKKRDMLAAHACWKRAMVIRYQNMNSPLLKPIHKSPIATYLNAVEVQTYDQLQELIEDPDAMRMQALLIRERILGPGHPDTAYYIRFRGATYADIGRYDRCILLWMYALDVQQQMHEPLNPMTQSSLLSFAELFSCMMSDECSHAGHIQICFRDILNVFHRAVKEISTAMRHTSVLSEEENGQFHRTLLITIHLVGLICQLQPHMSSEEDLEFKRSVYGLVHMNPRGRFGWTPLHVACYKETAAIGRYPIFTFPSREIVELLLEVGADPNAMDDDQNTPLHIAAMNRPCAHDVFKTLLHCGAHLDLRNKARKTALQVAYRAPIDIYPMQHLNLQCLSARAVRKSEIPYRGIVPKKLESFLDVH